MFHLVCTETLREKVHFYLDWTFYKPFSVKSSDFFTQCFCAVCFSHFNGIVVASLARCYVKLCWNQLWVSFAVSELYMCGTWSCCLLSIQISHFGLGCKGAHWFGTLCPSLHRCALFYSIFQKIVWILCSRWKFQRKVHFKYLDDA